MKKIFLSFLFLSVVGCATIQEEKTPSPTPQSPQALAEARRQQVSDLVSRGDEYLARKKFDAASLFYQEALKLQPGDPALSRKLEQTKKGKEELVNTATTFASNSNVSSKVVVERHIENAKNLIKSNKFEEAIQVLRKASEIDPGNIRVWFNLGTVLHNTQRFDEAVLCYQEAHKINPKDVNVNRHLGIVYIQVNRINEAKTHLEYVISTNPKDKEALLNLGALYQIMADALRNESQRLIDRASQIP